MKNVSSMRLLITLVSNIAWWSIMILTPFIFQWGSHDLWLIQLIWIFTLCLLLEMIWISSIIFGKYLNDKYFPTLDEELEKLWIDTIDNMLRFYGYDIVISFDHAHHLILIGKIGIGRTYMFDYILNGWISDQTDVTKRKLIHFFKTNLCQQND